MHPKIRSLIHFNHTKKFQKSMFFPTFIARALPWLRPTIFKAKCLRMVSINSEYLNLSMVEPAPENLAPWLLYPPPIIDTLHKSQHCFSPQPLPGNVAYGLSFKVNSTVEIFKRWKNNRFSFGYYKSKGFSGRS